ncbi:hypothetical protein QYE76_022478 [Lolium multiflorum]|uniref:Uncharacterized protein n=1 Tax=Lolium multiflorum TaxID=4521 RepID=A0AAD8RAD6_LOLMU|nr:hypothetical protein QYE76_022478 [Lolium multiflorum]
MAPPSGSWEGSYMKEDDIARLVRLRRILPGVITRAPGGEVEPAPKPGELVVFGAHFDRGLGLPASPFRRSDFFGLQPHRLPARVLLSCYVAFMEGYAGLWPDVDFWSRLFYEGRTTTASLGLRRRLHLLPARARPSRKIPTVDSVKKWQMSFFYVEREPGARPAQPAGVQPGTTVGRINGVQRQLFFQGIEDSDLLRRSGRPRRSGDQAGDDDLPERMTKAAKGSTTRRLRSRGGGRARRPQPRRFERCPGREAAFPTATSVCAKGKKRVASGPRRAGGKGRSSAGLLSSLPRVPARLALQRFRAAAARESRLRGRRRAHVHRLLSPPSTGAVLSLHLAELPARHSWRGRRRAGLHSTRCSRAVSGSWARREPAGELGGLRLPRPGRRVRAEVVILDAGSDEAPSAPGSAIPTGPAPLMTPPPSSEPARDESAEHEPARATDADVRALVTTRQGPARCPMVFMSPRPPCCARGTVSDRRTALYNRLVVGYHKAKNERAEMARELEAAQASFHGREADLEPPRRHTMEEAAKAVTTKAQETHGELERLRWLESNHVAELKAAKENGRKEVEDLSRRLKDVEQQCRALRDEVTSKSQELTDTAKRWVSQMSALDRGFAGRGARRRTTAQSSDCFSMDDYLASMAARVEPITKLGWELRKAAEADVAAARTETASGELANLIKWLETAPDRFLDWKDSRARATWRSPSLSCSGENKTARLARACAIAAFVDKGVFIADPNPLEDDSDEEPEDEEIEMEAPPGARPAGPPPGA